jgi:hypothetical protein
VWHGLKQSYIVSVMYFVFLIEDSKE